MIQFHRVRQPPAWGAPSRNLEGDAVPGSCVASKQTAPACELETASPSSSGYRSDLGMWLVGGLGETELREPQVLSLREVAEVKHQETGKKSSSRLSRAPVAACSSLLEISHLSGDAAPLPTPETDPAGPAPQSQQLEIQKASPEPRNLPIVTTDPDAAKSFDKYLISPRPSRKYLLIC